MSSGVSWSITAAPQSLFYSSIAMSSDGKYMIAGTNYGAGIYLSSDYGEKWYQSTAPSGSNLLWQAVSSSSTGESLVGCTYAAGVYFSLNYGQTWYLSTGVPTNTDCRGLAVSKSGEYIALASYKNGLYLSNNYGQTWTKASTSPNLLFNSIASSSSGQYLAAVCGGDAAGNIYTSSNYGSTWVTTNAPVLYWDAIASDSTGEYLTAGYSTNHTAYLSNFYGVQWFPQNIPSSDPLKSIVASSSGQYLAAISTSLFYIYTSGNSGYTWYPSSAPLYYWSGVATSSNGKLLAATSENFHGIYLGIVSYDDIRNTNDALSPGQIAAIVFGVFGIIIVLVFLGYLYNFYRVKLPETTNTSQSSVLSKLIAESDEEN